MKEQSTTRPYKEMAKELKIKPASFRSQLTKLRDMDLVESTDRESQHWVITSPAEKSVKVSVKESVNRTVNRTVSETVKENEANNEVNEEAVKETGEGDESTLSHFVQ